MTKILNFWYGIPTIYTSNNLCTNIQDLWDPKKWYWVYIYIFEQIHFALFSIGCISSHFDFSSKYQFMESYSRLILLFFSRQPSRAFVICESHPHLILIWRTSKTGGYTYVTLRNMHKFIATQFEWGGKVWKNEKNASLKEKG